jgi:xylitol oxidase
MTPGTNWAGNYRYRAERLLTPTSVAEVREIAGRATALRVLGSRHSFNDIADTAGDQLSLGGLAPDVSIDRAARTVSFSAGLRYGDLAAVLERGGWALHNLASLPHISVAGAIATGTHGSGDRNGSLATAVTALDLVTSTGDLLTLTRSDPDFAGAVVNVGSLGVVTRIELAIEPSFEVRQDVIEGVAWTAVEQNFTTITSAGYSVSLFTDWGADGVQQVWLKNRIDSPSRAEAAEAVEAVDAVAAAIGARHATEARHPLAGISAENCTEQLGVPGPWNDRLPHFRFEFTPSNGAEIQSEYLVPREHAIDAIAALRALGPRISPLLQVGEIRTVAADALWLSAAYERDTVGFHFTWLRDQAGVEAVLPLIEDALGPFAARPHWGKLFLSSAAELDRLYPRLAEFRGLAERLDPAGVFRNAFASRYLFGE